MGIFSGFTDAFEDVLGFAFGWLKDALVPEVPKPEGGLKATYASPDAKFPVIYGTRGRVNGVIVFQETNEGSNDDIKNELLHLIIVWGEGQCQSIDQVYIEEDTVDSSRFIYNGDTNKRWVWARNFPNGMGNYSDPYLTAAGWRESDKLEGKCCTYLRCEYTQQEGVWGGFPKVSADIRGRMISTPSGGALTASSNPVDQLYDLLKSPIYGEGLPTSLIDVASFQAQRALPNTQVEEVIGSGVYRNLYTSNVILDTDKEVSENVDILLKSMRAALPRINGKRTLVIEQDSAPADFSLTEDGSGTSCTIIELGKITENNKDATYDRVIVKYTDPDAEWQLQEAIWPEVDSDYEAEQFALAGVGDGLLPPNEHSVTLESCTNFYEAKHYAKMLYEIAKEGLRTQVIAEPEASILTPGDIIPVTHSFPGWLAKLFRVEKVSESMDTGLVTLTLREHQPYIYDFENTGEKPEILDTSLTFTNPAAPTSLTATPIYNSFAQVQLTWDGTTTNYEVAVYLSGTLILNEVIGRKEYDLKRLVSGTYDVYVRAIGGLNRRSEWAELSVSIIAPITPTGIPRVSSLPGRIDVEPPTPDSIDHTYEFRYHTSADATVRVWGKANVLNLSPVVADVTYSIEYRLVSENGAGAWIEVEVNGIEQLLYTWVAYADDDIGTGISLSPAGKDYYGVATGRTTETPQISDPSVYKWIEQQGGAQGAPALNLVLSNENHTISVAADGSGGNYAAATTTAQVLVGLVDDTAAWTISSFESTGVVGSLTGTTYSVTNMTVDQGYVDISASRVSYPTMTKRFTLSKARTGADGIDGADGADGKSSAQVSVFKRSATAPATPTGGSFNFDTSVLTPPAGWSTTPPAGTNPVYVVYAIATVIGGTGTDSSLPWTDPALLVQNGADGADGSDGIDGLDGSQGLSIYQATIFRRSASAPATPTGGSYNFGTNTLTAPSGWSNAIPAGTDPLYTSNGSFSIAGTTGTDTTTWTAPVKSLENGTDGEDGIDGVDGRSTYLFPIYKRAATKPSVPTGGSFNFGTNTGTAPASWSTSVPDGTDAVWTTTALASIDGDTGTDSTLSWGSVSLLGSGGGYSSFVYKVVAEGDPAPSTPTGGSFNGTSETIPSGWTDDPTYAGIGTEYVSKSVYRQQSTGSWTRSPDWSTPAIHSKKGNTGDPGPVGPSAPGDGMVIKDQGQATLGTSYTTVAEITIPPGTWDISSSGVFTSEGTSHTLDVIVTLGGVTQDSRTRTGTSNAASISFSDDAVVIGSTTTLKLQGKVSTTSLSDRLGIGFVQALEVI